MPQLDDESRRPVPFGDGQYGVEVRRHDKDVVVATVCGDLDYVVTPRLRRRLLEPIDGSIAIFVLDLTQVTLLSAAAMETVLELDALAADRGCRLLLVATTRAVRRPLSLLGLDRRLQLRSSVPQAMQRE